MLLIACLVLAALLGCLTAAVTRPARLWPATAIALSVLWPFADKPLEGPTLWVVSAGHGLTVADLVTPICLIAGMWLLRRALVTRRTVPLLPSSYPGKRSEAPGRRRSIAALAKPASRAVLPRRAQ